MDKDSRLVVEISKEMKNKLKIKALQEGYTMSAVLLDFITVYITEEA